MRIPQVSRRFALSASVRLVIALVAALSLLALVAYAATHIGTRNNARSYLEFRNSTTDGWDPLKTPMHFYATSANPSPNSHNVAYCLDHKKDFPLGSEHFSAFDSAELYNYRTRMGLRVILQKGYPAASAMVWGTRVIDLNDDQARYATANAIRAWLKESAGIGYNFMDLSDYDPARSGTWKLVRPSSGNSGDKNTMLVTLLLLKAARAQDVLHPAVSASAPAMTLQAGAYTGTSRIALTDCVGGYKIKSKPSWLTITGYTGKHGDTLRLSAPRAYVGQPVRVTLEALDNRTPANLYWYTPSSSNLQHFLAADLRVQNVAAQGTLGFDLPIGTLRIGKKAADDGSMLGGATFRIYQGTASGGTVLIDTVTTGDDGWAACTLPPGTYNVYEVVPPSGFKVDPNPQTVTVTDGGSIELEFTDERAGGRVFIQKVSSADGESILPTATPPDDGGGGGMTFLSMPLSKGRARVAAGAGVRSPAASVRTGAASGSVASATSAEKPLAGAVFELLAPRTVELEAHLTPDTLLVNGVGAPVGNLVTMLSSPEPADEVTVTAIDPSGCAVLMGSSLIGLAPGDGMLQLGTTITGLSTVLPFTVEPYPIDAGATALTLEDGPDVSDSVSVMSTSTVYGRTGQPLYLPPTGESVSLEATWTDAELSFGEWDDGAAEPTRTVTASELPLSFTLLSASTDASGNVTEATSTLTVPATTVLPLPAVHTTWTFQNGPWKSVIATLTTGADGTVMSEPYDPGTYYLREVAAPKGYELDPELHEFFLSAGQTAIFKIADRPRRGAMHLIKTDAVTGAHLAGAEFEISAEDGSVVATLTTAENGSAEATGLVPGDYTVTETHAPVGWAITAEVATFTVDPMSESPTITISFADEPLSRLRIVKRNALGKHGTLPGAQFTVFDASDDTTAAVVVTGQDGVAETDLLPLGEYYAVETSAPAGFDLDTERHYVTLAAGGGASVSLEIANTPTNPNWGGVAVFFRHVWDNTEVAKSAGFDAPAGTDFMPWVRASGFEGKNVAGFAYTGREDIPVAGPTAGGYDTPPVARLYTNAPGSALDANGQPVTVETKPGVVYGQPDPATPEVADGTTYKPFGVLGAYKDVAYVSKAPTVNRLIAGKLVLTYWYKRAITGAWKNIGVAPKTGDWRSGKIASAELAKSGTLSREELTRRLEAAKRRNPEVVGYLNVPGTGIHYPVVQGPDNSKYLTRDATGAKSARGAIFADVRCSPYVKCDSAARSTILYGHNMKDGTMFGRLDSYGSSEGFYRAHPLVQYVDAAGNGGLWRVYSVRKSTTTDSVYTYPVTTPYARRVASWSARSAVDVGFKPKTDGWSLTLSTCTYDRADGNGRILVQGELIEGYSNGAAGD